MGTWRRKKEKLNRDAWKTDGTYRKNGCFIFPVDRSSPLFVVFPLPSFLFLFFFLPLSRDRVRTVYFSRAPIGISAVPNDSAPSSDEHAHFRRCTRNYGGAISNGRRGACDTQPTTGFRNSRGRLIWKSGRFANRSFQDRSSIFYLFSRQIR